MTPTDELYKRLIKLSIGGFVTSWLISCSSVAFYKDEQLTNPTGLRYYSAKPYLLVSHTGAKDKPVEVRFEYLPNLEDPTYAKFIPGFGQHDFSLKLTNGILTEYGQKGDTKVDELLSSVAGIMTASAARISAQKDDGEAKSMSIMMEPAKCPKDLPQLEDFTKKLESISIEYENAVRARAQLYKYTLPHMLKRVNNIGEALKTEVAILKKAAQESDFEKWPKCGDIAARLDKIALEWLGTRLDAPETEVGQVLTKNFETLRQQLLFYIDLVEPPVMAITDEFQLYEVVIRDGRTTLTPARFRKAPAPPN